MVSLNDSGKRALVFFLAGAMAASLIWALPLYGAVNVAQGAGSDAEEARERLVVGAAVVFGGVGAQWNATDLAELADARQAAASLAQDIATLEAVVIYLESPLEPVPGDAVAPLGEVVAHLKNVGLDVATGDRVPGAVDPFLDQWAPLLSELGSRIRDGTLTPEEAVEASTRSAAILAAYESAR